MQQAKISKAESKHVLLFFRDSAAGVDVWSAGCILGEMATGFPLRSLIIHRALLRLNWCCDWESRSLWLLFRCMRCCPVSRRQWDWHNLSDFQEARHAFWGHGRFPFWFYCTKDCFVQGLYRSVSLYCTIFGWGHAFRNLLDCVTRSKRVSWVGSTSV